VDNSEEFPLLNEYVNICSPSQTRSINPLTDPMGTSLMISSLLAPSTYSPNTILPHVSGDQSILHPILFKSEKVSSIDLSVGNDGGCIIDLNL